MLPDFPRLKQQIVARLAQLARSSAQADPVLSAIPSFRQHEGNRAELIRLDGSVAAMNFDNPLSAETTIRVDDVRREGPMVSIRAMREVGDRLAAGMMERTIDTISAAVEAVGNVVDGKGQPFTAELYAEALEKMELSFDADGEWMPPTILVGTALAAKIQAGLEAIDQDPATRDRITNIIERKREEWRAREARRALVD